MEKVLVIEDNEDILENICELLNNEGYQTISSSNIDNGEKLVLEHFPDLILCDIRMKTESDGFEFLKIAQEKNLITRIPFIFLTVLGESENIVKGLKMGAQDYIVKPYKKEVLLARIRVHLDLRQAILNLEKLNKKLEEEKSTIVKINYELKQQIEKFKENKVKLKPEKVEKDLTAITNQYKENPELIANYKNIDKTSLISMLKKNEFKQIFEILKLKVSDNHNLENDVILLNCDFDDLKRDYVRGLLDRNSHQNQLNQIRDRLLILIDDIFDMVDYKID